MDRAEAVAFIIDTHRQLIDAKPQTLFLACNILDRYLSHTVQLGLSQDAAIDLKLICVGCLKIASKFEDICAAQVADIEAIHRGSKRTKKYSVRNVMNMELEILVALDFEVAVPTVHFFMSRFFHLSKACQIVRFMSMYIADAALLEYNMLKYTPSMISTAAVVLAREILFGLTDGWEADMQVEVLCIRQSKQKSQSKIT